MKKLILSIVLLAAMAVCQAQEKSTKSEVTFGAKAGVNISTAVFDESIENYVPSVSSVVGANLSFFVNLPMGSKFALQPEIVYSMQGFDYVYDNEYARADIKTRLNYVTVPFNFQFKFIEKAYIEAGPQFDFLVGAKGDYTSKDKFSNQVTSLNDKDLKDNYKALVFGLNFGAGYKITEAISANVRYCLGLTPANQGNTLSSKNRVIQIGAAYSF
ncbi:porin family protein [Flavobacterium sp.]|uniref:porin family protein n=1 Tax=Flavobacterium sp. TaxID=239 RepID=UPI0026111274|nr:porin family protein [Flavobacterium sp.]